MRRPRRLRTIVISAVAGVACVAAAMTAGAALADSGEVTVYLATSGNDDSAGSSAAPVKTLQGVKRVLKAQASSSATIIVRPGVYYESTMVKWGDVPQQALTFRRDGGTARPVFDGSRLTGSTQYWMNTAGGPVLDVRELQVRNYRTGALRLDTDGNTVRNMVFEKLGNRHVSGGDGYAAVHLLGSSDNVITRNVFRDLENTDCPGCIHGVYAATDSDGNQITDNRFSDVTGDVVRLRDGTDDNLIEANSFTTSGSAAANRALVSFWLFTTNESCGSGNQVKDNEFDGRFYNGASGQQIAGSGAEPGLSRCAKAIGQSGNTRT